jgi:hypothetical protein
MNSLLEKLHDIEGLDPISWWPLAIGWWILIIIAILLVCAIAWFMAYQFTFKRSWRNETFQKLLYLEKNLTDATARETVIAISEYLRRIALQRFSREECAGLVGEDWLKWLTLHDPKNFNWEKKGILLIEVPYAPSCYTLSTHQIKDLIQAVRHWVR